MATPDTPERAMQAFSRLFSQHPIVFLHLLTAFSALLLGLFILLRKKGSTRHKQLGWAWVGLMSVTALASIFIRDYRGLNLAGFTPIHLFTVVTLTTLPMGIWFARRGIVTGHRKTMKSLYLGACAVAGAFTLIPGRFLGNLLWKQWLGVLS
jgi:uncharacterized membrane protein